MLPYKSYTPDDRLRTGPFKAVMTLGSEIWRFRFQAQTAFMRDFVTGYRGTIFGVFWNIALPLVPIGFYVILAVTRIVPQFEDVAGSVAIALNATLWFFFAGCVRIPIDVTHSRNAEAMRTSIPLSVSILAGFGGLVFDTLVRLVAVAALILITGSLPDLLAPLALVPIALGAVFFLGLGLFLAILNIAAPDIKKITDSMLGYGIFISGVIFPLASMGPLVVLEFANPFAVFIEASRLLMFQGALTDWQPLAAWSTASIMVFLLGARLFYVMEKRIRGVV
jgi:ABC-type polysaccharide/polyol phosphate export permease